VTTLQKWPLQGKSIDLSIHNTDSSDDLEVFLTKGAADAGSGNGTLIGPGMGLQVPAECVEFWTYATAAVTFRALAITRP
jgi:hypothetical protein